MKKSDPRRFRSLRELRLYRQGLELDIQKAELDIREDISGLAEALSPMNIIRAIVAQISTIRLVSAGLSLAKNIFFRKKNKKKGKDDEGDG
jgi:hypothetical protein